jgi:hypothetical protein
VLLTAEFLAYRAALRAPELLPGYPLTTVFPEFPAVVFAETVDLPETFEDNL